MQRITKLVLGVSVAACVAAFGACGGSDATTGPSGDDSEIGTYVLTKVDGSAPPGIYHLTASERLMLDTATIRLASNNAYSDIRTTTLFDASGEHKATISHTGTYTLGSGTVSLSYNNDLGIPSTEVATLSGKVLTKTESGVVLTFTKK
jgi:hypothetical protein